VYHPSVFLRFLASLFFLIYHPWLMVIRSKHGAWGPTMYAAGRMLGVIKRKKAASEEIEISRNGDKPSETGR